jgi:hypothetical protein
MPTRLPADFMTGKGLSSPAPIVARWLYPLVGMTLIAACGSFVPAQTAPPSASPSQSNVASSCTNILASAPQPGSTVLPAMTTHRLMATGKDSKWSVAIDVPASLTEAGAQEKDPGSVLSTGPSTGFYPEIALRFFEHYSTTYPDGPALARLEAGYAEKDVSQKIIPPVVVASIDRQIVPAGVLTECFSPDSNFADPHTLAISYVIPVFVADAYWVEFFVQVITTVERYGTDRLVGDAVARSLKWECCK